MAGFGMLVASSLVFFVPSLVLWQRFLLGHKRVGACCYQCGYDWRRVPIERCPECGAAFLARGARPPMRRSLRILYLTLASILTLVWITAGREIVRSFEVPFADGASALRAVAAGRGNKTEIINSVREALRPLSDAVHKVQGATGEAAPSIMSGIGNTKLTMLTEVLQTDSLSESQFDAVLQGFADEYRTQAIWASSDCDQLLADMLAQSRESRFPNRFGNESISTSIRELTTNQRNLLIELFLELQAKPDRAWNEAWGRGIEGAAKLGHLTPEQAQRYIEQRYLVKVTPQDLVYAGDHCTLTFSVFRRGSDFDFPASLRVTSGDAVWNERLRGGVVNGELMMRDRDTASCVVFLPDTLGDLVLPLDVELTFDKQAIDDFSEYFDYDGDARRGMALAKQFPATVCHKQLKVQMTLQPSPAQPVQLGNGEATPAQFGHGMDLYPDYWTTSDGTIVSIGPTTVAKGLGHAANVFVRQDGIEHPIGWCFKSRLGDCVINAVGLVPSLDINRDAEVVMRSAAGPLLRPIWTPRIWDGEVVRPLKFQRDRYMRSKRPPFVRTPKSR